MSWIRDVFPWNSSPRGCQRAVAMVLTGLILGTEGCRTAAAAKTPPGAVTSQARTTASPASVAGARQAAPPNSPTASPTSSPTTTMAPPSPLRPGLVPLPVSVTWIDGQSFTVTPASAILVPPNDLRAALVAALLSGWMTTIGSSGPSVLPTSASSRTGAIVLSVDPSSGNGSEGYELSVSAAGVRITASTAAGLFYGAQTLRQLLPPYLEHKAARPQPIVIPAVEILDKPRFEWRGAMLDVARHFFGPSDVKRYLDLMALHKLNRLHLHLSDDQGWRIEIKSWPNLTAVGGRTQVGGGRGGFFTQIEYAEIVAYARDRFIDIIPEIDMPGHTNAALASYAELNCDKVAPPAYTDIRVGFSSLCVADVLTYKFIDDVVREIGALTPGSYFHVGGDEVRKLTAAEYESFIYRVQDIVESRGKKMIGWDEVAMATLHPASVIQHWRPGTKLTQVTAGGVRLIMSPGNRTYLDMQYDAATPLGLSWAGRIEVKDAYSWDPATLMEGVGESAVIGVEGPLWSETLSTMRDVETMAYPRLAVLAEVGWTAQSRRAWEDFRVRLGALGPRWQALGINFYRSPQIPWRP
ncbi:MAG: family 20 glycosylhydrolase [Vicinamibacteria bacterium]